MIINSQDALFLALSVATTVTILTPLGNSVPGSLSYVMRIYPPMLSLAEALYPTFD